MTTSRQELQAKARQYDNQINDGAEGYNPYRNDIAEMDATREVSLDERRTQILESLQVADSAAAREAGLDNSAEIANLKAELVGVDEAIRNAKLNELSAAGWTPEIAVERATAMNARVRAGEFTGRNGKVDMSKLAAAEQAQGWTLAAMKAAVATYKDAGLIAEGQIK